MERRNRARSRLSMQLTREMLHEIMGLWPWLSPKARADLEEMTLAGQHWMFTPWHTLELVHAVQRPLVTPEFRELFASRSLNETSARPIFTATCSIKSTDRVDLL